MKRLRNGSTDLQERPTPANLTFYIVLLVSALAGLVAYNSGTSLEGSLMRAGLVLLACTVVGYLLNVVLWLAARAQGVAAPGAATPSGAQTTGRRVNLLAGEDNPLDELSLTGAGARTANSLGERGVQIGRNR